ncbi:MAG: hypothetical protein F6K19_37670 [Cyanothece sp. SIO1E1]|nr:hypothetical protein [Cyanothece sp. SIO1E1]
MVNSIESIIGQARQGSVAAIIQILNEKLADAGIRTRAIFNEGVLQLLCEANQPEAVEQSTLVNRIRKILEYISPRNIRKVNICCRTVREQQLLWLEEISRDPEGQLLWSELVTLSRPNPIKRLLDNFKTRQATTTVFPKSISPAQLRQRQQFRRGAIGGAGLIVLLLLLGWILQTWRQANLQQVGQAINFSSEAPSFPQPNATLPNNRGNEVAASPPLSTQPDPFVEAVRLAEQAAIDGQIAQSPAEWLDLAARWQQASDLMKQISPTDSRYTTAQDRAINYQLNSEATLKQAEQSRSE